MSQVNWNVNGDPGDDQPQVVADNPWQGSQLLESRFEGTPINRFVAVCPPGLTGGASLNYDHGRKTMRFILPIGDGQYEADLTPVRPPEYGPDVDMTIKYGPVVARRTGVVHAIGQAWADDGGPYYPLGDTLLYALGHFYRGGAKLELLRQNLAFIASHGHDYVRALGEVNWQSDMDIDPTWGAYEDSAAAFLDMVYSEFGLRLKLTVTGGGTNPRLAAEKWKRVIGAGRHHMIQLIESVNEGNASDADAIWVARSMSELGVPTACGKGNQGLAAVKALAALAGTATCFHQERALGGNSDPGGPHARQVRQCWDYKEFEGLVEDGEGPGPTSSGQTLDDPYHLAMKRASNIMCGAGASCLHTGHGVYGVDMNSPYGFRFASLEQAGVAPAMAAVRNADSRLPRGIENWRKFNGGFGGPLLIEPANGAVNKVYGARDGGLFVETIIGCTGTNQLRAQQPGHVRVTDPVSADVLFDGHVNAGQTFQVPERWGYILDGAIGA